MIYGLFTKREVMMAGYWPRSVIDQDGVEVHTQMKKEANIQPSLPNNAGSVKASLYGKGTVFSFGTQWVIPSRQDSAILPVRVANHSPGLQTGIACSQAYLARSRSLPYKDLQRYL